MNVLELAKQVIDIEIESLKNLSLRLDHRFEEAVGIIRECQGHVVVIGMGKSGIIGRKIAATFASTGTPSFFVHPGEAFHGDLGMIKPGDVALLISYSGETEELLRLFPFFDWQKNKTISITGKMSSTLARHTDVALDISILREACSNNLAPTSSTTATLVLGDALAVTLSSLKNFQPEDFARFHPGGNLGRRLLTKVKDVMHTKNLPVCSPDSRFLDIVRTMTVGRLGLTLIMDGEKFVGLITDGDLRRALERFEEPMKLVAKTFMTTSPKTADPEELLAPAEKRMKEAKLGSLIVLDGARTPVGVLQVFDGG